MDILLIQPPVLLRERYRHHTGNVGGHLPPLNLASLAAYVRQGGHTVSIIDGNVAEKKLSDIVDSIPINTRVAGLTAITSNFHLAEDIAKKIKKNNPSVLIVLGGHHATTCINEILEKENCFDFIVYGEGEETFLELVDKFRETNYDKKEFFGKNRVLEKIRGIGYRVRKMPVVTEKRNLINDIDKLPLPARDLLPMKKYTPLPNNYKRLPATSIIVSRGCPYECIFCSANKLFGRKLRLRSPGKVLEELRQLVEDYGVKEVSFWDDTLTVNPEWLTKLCNLMIEEGVNISWTCLGRVNNVTLELLLVMKKAGCWNICYGIESGSQELLNIIGKGTRLDQIRKAVSWTKSVGIEIRGSFMLALPGETPDLAVQTIDFARELDLDYAQFCITTPYPGTKLYEDASIYGSLSSEFSEYTCWEPVFIPYGYENSAEVKRMSRKAMRSFYLRLSYILKKVKGIRSFEDLKRHVTGLRLIMGFLL